MRKEDTIRLDTHFLVRRIEVLELKQSWVADQVGVARKTVSRWCTGKVKRLGRDSAESLAEVLRCQLSELTVSDEVDVLATKEEQKVAAKLIQQNDLLELLSPSDNWALAESLIKASLQPDLPLVDLGRLYNLLSIAAWRQGNYAEGVRHAERAREIAEQTGDRGLLCGATYNQAVIDSLLGDLGAALAGYERCLEAPEFFETRRDHAKVLSNTGDAYRSFMRYPESLAAQDHALRVFGELNLDQNLAIGWVSKGMLLCEWGRFDDAREAYTSGAEAARRANFVRGVDCAPIYLADPLSLAGEREAARAQVEAALPSLAKHGVYDLGCHQIAARVFRRAGALEAAAGQVSEGLRRSEPFPELRGMIQLEGARLAAARGDAAGEAGAREAANEAFLQAGLAVRVQEGALAEHGSLSDSARE